MFFAAPSTFLMLLITLSGGVPLPLGVPPLPEDPVLARIAPQECLFYLSSSGMAQPDPKSKNQTEQLLAEPEVRNVMPEIERLVVSMVRQEGARGGPDAGARAENVARWLKLALTRPAALFISRLEVTAREPIIYGGLMVRVGPDAANLGASIEKHQAAAWGEARKVLVRGVTCYRVKISPDAPEITWGIQGEYLVAGIGDGTVEGVLQRMRGTPPAWLTAARKQLPVERVSTVTYVNIKRIIDQFAPQGGPRVKVVIDALGLGNVTSLASVAGLQGEGAVSRTLIGFSGQPAGVFKALGEKPLTAADLASIPRDTTLAAAKRVDAATALDVLLDVAGNIEPRSRQEMTQGLAALKQHTGVDLREDVLKSLGDAWCVYNSPGEGGLIITGLTAVVPVKDHQRLAAAHAKLLAAAQAALKEAARPPKKKTTTRKKTAEEEEEEKEEAKADMFERYRPRPWLEQFDFAGRKVNVFHIGDNAPFAPAWCLTEKELIVAILPQQVKAYLSRGPASESLAAVSEVAEVLKGPEGPVAMLYSDVRQTMEIVYPLLPMILEAASREFAREGIPFSSSMVPSAPAIYKHLRPAVMTVRRTEAGLQLESRGTVPGAAAAPLLPLAGSLFWLAAVPMHADRAFVEQAAPVEVEKVTEPAPPAPAEK